MHKARNVGGLKNVGKGDREVWEAFHRNWEELASKSEEARERLKGEEGRGAKVETSDSACYTRLPFPFVGLDGRG
jgi:hypothetical protein